MKKEQYSEKTLFLIFSRYLIILVVALNLSWIYRIFKPLTIYPSFFLLKLFFKEAMLKNDFIIVGEKLINLIPACIGGSAYLLLFILTLSIRQPVLQLISSLSFLVFSLLVFNISRIFILGVLFVKGFFLFELTHAFFWYFMSIVFVVLLWFVNVKIFSIREIPFYSDFKIFLEIIQKNR